MEILSAEIIDNTVTQQRQISETEFEEFIQPSEISVLVEIEFQEKNYHLDFQSTTTNDYGAYSSNLAAYDGTDDYDSLSETVNDDDKFENLLEQIKTESDAQKIRDEYVEENYKVESDHFGGMDANSEINKAVKK